MPKLKGIYILGREEEEEKVAEAHFALIRSCRHSWGSAGKTHTLITPHCKKHVSTSYCLQPWLTADVVPKIIRMEKCVCTCNRFHMEVYLMHSAAGLSQAFAQTVINGGREKHRSVLGSEFVWIYKQWTQLTRPHPFTGTVRRCQHKIPQPLQHATVQSMPFTSNSRSPCCEIVHLIYSYSTLQLK